MTTTEAIIRGLLDRGLKQAEIVRITGIPQSRLSKWQSGEAGKAADDAIKLAHLAASYDREAAKKAIAEIIDAIV